MDKHDYGSQAFGNVMKSSRAYVDGISRLVSEKYSTIRAKAESLNEEEEDGLDADSTYIARTLRTYHMTEHGSIPSWLQSDRDRNQETKNSSTYESSDRPKISRVQTEKAQVYYPDQHETVTKSESHSSFNPLNRFRRAQTSVSHVNEQPRRSYDADHRSNNKTNDDDDDDLMGRFRRADTIGSQATDRLRRKFGSSSSRRF